MIVARGAHDPLVFSVLRHIKLERRHFGAIQSDSISSGPVPAELLLVAGVYMRSVMVLLVDVAHDSLALDARFRGRANHVGDRVVSRSTLLNYVAKANLL